MLSAFLFLEGDPLRSSRIALVGDLPISLPEGLEPGVTNVSVAEPSGSTVVVKEVVARTLHMTQAIDWLMADDLDDEDPVVRYWAVVTRIGVEIIARGRLHPGITPAGHDAWKVGPYDAADSARREELAAAMPPSAHRLAIDGTDPVRLRSPRSVITTYWDAIADVVVRSPAAGLVSRNSPFALAQPSDVSAFRDALQSFDTPDVGALKLGFRLVPPFTDQDDFSVIPYLQSTTDQSLSIDAADLWDAPPTVLRRLGDDAEDVMLRSLRRAAKAWPVLSGLLEQDRPDRLVLSESDFDELVDKGSAQLESFGFEVAWPRELAASRLSVRASVKSVKPSSSKKTRFDLNQAMELKWEATLDGEQLSEAEMRQLVEAKRSVVRLRGRWIVVDGETIERIQAQQKRKAKDVTAGSALSAALGGSLSVDGDLFDVEVDSVLGGLAERIRNYEPNNDLEAPATLEAELRPYQRRGLAWLNEMCELGVGGCLADDMGLGKTIQVIALHLHRNSGPTLVVCPASLLGNWEREIAKFAPGITTHRFYGRQRNLDVVGDKDIVLVTYGLIRREKEAMSTKEWDLVVADEAQHAKNPLSQTARALRSIPSNVRLALTGTPVENQLTELWSILDWTTPGLLGGLEDFRRNVAAPIERNRDEDVAAELAKVVRPFLLRRRKIDPDIAPELPRKTESDLFVPLTTEQASLYKAVTEEVLESIKQKAGIERRGLVLKLLTALKQICNHPAQYLKQAGPLSNRSGKLAAFDELIDGLEGTNESVLVFSQYVQMGKLLERHLAEKRVSSLFLHGSVPAHQRDQMVEQFQAGQARVFLLSLKAGGTGLNLTRATHVIHYDRWWNPAVEDQATDRAYRIGQTQAVQVHRMVTEGTLEERIAALLADKRDLSEQVIGSGEAWVSEFSDSELAELVALSDAL